MAFKLPFIKSNPRPNKLAGIKNFAFDELSDKDEIGRGGFGTVFTARYKGETVVIKKLLTLGAQDVKGFEKEVQLLSKVKHPNIVGFRAFSINPYSIMLDFEYFSFEPFNKDTRAYSLDGFLRFVNSIDEVQTFASIFPKIATDIAGGLHYLHSMEIAHRDMKPGNVLVSNVHYSDTKGIAFEEMFQRAPIICKLTDFGESRSNMVQTNTLLHSKTSNIDRGTVPYMAPEIMVPGNSLADASFEELAKVDIWGFGMTLFNLLNPDILYPYELDIKRTKTSAVQAKGVIIEMLSRNTLPSISGKYEKLNATTWVDICDAFVRTTSFKASERPSSAEVYQLLTSSNVKPNYQVFQVGVSQSTAFDVAQENFNRNQSGSCGLFVRPENDATNACTFLSLLVAHEIASKGLANEVEWAELAKEVNNIITTAPIIFNKHRNDRPYSADEALKLMKASRLLPDKLYLTEEILSRFGPFSLEGRECLKEALHIGNGNFVGVYTCEPYSFAVGHVNGSYFAIDTHSVGEECMGDGNAIVIIFTSPHIQERLQAVCRWIWKRLGCGSTKCSSMQSFSRLKLPENSDQNVHIAPLNCNDPGSCYSDSSPLNHREGNKLDVEGALSSHQTEVHSTHNVEVDDALFSHQTEVHSTHNVEVDDALSSQQTEVHSTHNVEVEDALSSHQTEDHSTHNVEVDDALSSQQTEVHSTHNVEVEDALSRHQTEDHSMHNIQMELTTLSGDVGHQSSSQEVLYVQTDHSEPMTEPHSLCRDGGPHRNEHANAQFNSEEQTNVSHSLSMAQSPLTMYEEHVKVQHDNSENRPMKFWKNLRSFPILEAGRNTRYSVNEAVNIILHATKTEMCHSHPLKVRENASFLIDVSQYKNWEDVKTDMNGVYNKVLRNATWTIEVEDPVSGKDTDADCNVLHRRKECLEDRSQFHLIQHFKGNKSSPELVRAMFLLRDIDGRIVNNCVLLQYYVSNGNDVHLVVGPHGNAKASRKPFYPSAKSLQEMSKDKLKTEAPSKVYQFLHKESEGPMKQHNAGHLPRSKHQLYDLKSRMKKAEDPIDELLIYAKHRNEEVILHHSDLPADVWVLGDRIMCNELGKFTSSPLLTFPFSVDPTFSLGAFEVTPVVYKHLFLRSKITGEHPVFLGPTMIHHRKDHATYKILSSVCATNCGNLKAAKGFITDGEVGLSEAFSSDLPLATHLRCFKHFENNCRAKLHGIGIQSRKDQSFFLRKVFGLKGKIRGILDAEDENELKELLEDAKEEIENNETTLASGQGEKYKPVFYDYILSHYDMMRDNMICNVRRQAGLPDGSDGKPVRCYTNMSESMNNVLKKTKGHMQTPGAKQNMSKLQFTKDVFETVVQNQRREVSLAIADLSDVYELAEIAKHCRLPQETWFEMVKEERELYIRQFHGMSIENAVARKPLRLQLLPSTPVPNEYADLSIDLVKYLREDFGYSSQTATALNESVLKLINTPTAVQKKTLASANRQ